MSGCTACGRRLYFSERVAWPQEFCFPCAAARGIERLADKTRVHNLRRAAIGIPAWWQWTVFLEHALRWDERVRRRLDGDYATTLNTFT